MLPITVNMGCKIIKGKLKGTKGHVIAFDYEKDEVTIKLDESTYVVTTHENIIQ